MNKCLILVACSSAAIASGLAFPAYAEENEKPVTAWEASRTVSNSDMIKTGVAKARDRLDSATSTSSMMDNEIVKMSATSLGDLFRNIPGIRAEASRGEVATNYTIRGLPMVSTGAKYLQFQEDGLPVMEFGDFFGFGSDTLLRPDFNLAQIESIRGGSASTFASNGPGGVINLVSKTGEVEGGSVQVSAGLDYESQRTDFDYGGRLSDTLRFHIGGFYRNGDNPRHMGYKSESGGQMKFNITKEFSGGYVRLYGKFLDDNNAFSGSLPIRVTGTDDDPQYSDVPNFDVRSDSLNSRYISAIPTLDKNGNVDVINPQDGYHMVSNALGLEAKFNVSGWSVTERFRYADQSGTFASVNPTQILPAASVTATPPPPRTNPFGAAGGSLVYANGPNAGQVVSPTSLLSYSLVFYGKADSLNYFTNDLRASRVWEVGGGDLTFTMGSYNSRQEFKYDQRAVSLMQTVDGDGNSVLVDIRNSSGTTLTQDGVISFHGPGFGIQKYYDVAYSIFAPYGSLNFHKGKVAVGASVRYDRGNVNGTVRGDSSTTPVQTIDIDNDGTITQAERTFDIPPVSANQPVNYDYSYLSYSASINYRMTDNFSTFARYSKGARAGADRILLTTAISTIDGSLLEKKSAKDPVQQAEVGLKYRTDGLFVNLTGFWAKVEETNIQTRVDPATQQSRGFVIHQGYRAYGAELEAGVRFGGFGLTGNATFTDASITKAEDPTIIGNTPRHQAKLIYQIMPQYDTDLFTVGANIIGTLDSYAQDTNQLKMPGYTTVNAFLQVRPMEKVVLSLNANNLFNVRALTEVSAATLPSAMNPTTTVATLYGRTISTSVRFYF